MATRKRPNELDRKVNFFRLDVGVDEAGAPLGFNPSPFLRRIDSLPYQAVGGRYSADDDGVFCCWVSDHRQPQKLKFGRIRQKDLPLYECGGNLSPLLLPGNGGLVDPVHMMLFYEAPHWYAVCEFNYSGPRITRLAKYLSEKGGCPGLSFIPLIRQDVVKQLQSYRDYRLLTVRCRPSYVSAIPKNVQQGRIEDLLDTAHAVGQDPTIDLTWRAAPRSAEGVSNVIVRSLLSILRHPDHQAAIEKAKLKAVNNDSGFLELIDLLNAQISAKVRVRRAGPRSASPDSDAMYVAIEQTYSRMRPLLLGATGFTPSNGALDEHHHVVA